GCLLGKGNARRVERFRSDPPIIVTPVSGGDSVERWNTSRGRRAVVAELSLQDAHADLIDPSPLDPRVVAQAPFDPEAAPLIDLQPARVRREDRETDLVEVQAIERVAA